MQRLRRVSSLLTRIQRSTLRADECDVLIYRTECGYISKFVSGKHSVKVESLHLSNHEILEPQSEDWEYFSLNPGINCRLVPRENGTFEPYVIASIFCLRRSMLQLNKISVPKRVP